MRSRNTTCRKRYLLHEMLNQVAQDVTQGFSGEQRTCKEKEEENNPLKKNEQERRKMRVRENRH